jgi:competence protein ComEC
VIAVWPRIAFNFGIISLIGPFSTLLIAPDLPFIILSGSFTAVIGLVSPDAAGVIGWVAWLFLSYMLLLVNAFSLLPGIYIGSSINSGLFWAYYSVLIILIWSLPRYWKLKGSITAYVSRLLSSVDRAAAVYTRLPLKFIIFPLLLIAALVSFTASTLPDKNLHVIFLDVGEGDAVLIQSGNQNILVDGGPSGQAVCLGLSRKLPYWDRDLDLVVLTHPHLDHLSGLVEVLHRYRVKQVLAPALIVESPFYREWTRLIDARNIRYTLAQTGQEIKLRNGAVIHVLHSPETSSGDPEYLVDNNSLVMRLDHSRISFLLTADIGRETEAALVNRRANLACTVLKVAHHGSATSTSPDFLRAAAPQAAVISAGRDNSFGHPDKEILSRLHEYFGTEERIFRTDTSGTVELSSDGETLRFKTG